MKLETYIREPWFTETDRRFNSERGRDEVDVTIHAEFTMVPDNDAVLPMLISELRYAWQVALQAVIDRDIVELVPRD